MSAGSAEREESRPLFLELRIDAACRSFEAAWEGAARPRIEDYLPAAEDAGAWPLLRELLKLELHYRRAENPSPEEYGRRRVAPRTRRRRLIRLLRRLVYGMGASQ
jgi:hypothetical protein